MSGTQKVVVIRVYVTPESEIQPFIDRATHALLALCSCAEEPQRYPCTVGCVAAEVVDEAVPE